MRALLLPVLRIVRIATKIGQSSRILRSNLIATYCLRSGRGRNLRSTAILFILLKDVVHLVFISRDQPTNTCLFIRVICCSKERLILDIRLIGSIIYIQVSLVADTRLTNLGTLLGHSKSTLVLSSDNIKLATFFKLALVSLSIERTLGLSLSDCLTQGTH